MKSRLHGKMSVIEAVMAIGGVNPGAIALCTELVNNGARIDPDAMSGIRHLFILDACGLYEERLYCLWSDVCERDFGKMIAVLRAHQLGELESVSLEAINHAINNRDASLDLDKIVKAVRNHLPSFNPQAI